MPAARLAVALAAATLAACAAAPASAPVSGPAGKAAYERACARCHDTGADGAPVTRVAADWAGRSPLWQAVLAEHARQGYLAMPARGGDAALTDRELRAATDYMLAQAYPRRPAD